MPTVNGYCGAAGVNPRFGESAVGSGGSVSTPRQRRNTKRTTPRVPQWQGFSRRPSYGTSTSLVKRPIFGVGYECGVPVKESLFKATRKEGPVNKPSKGGRARPLLGRKLEKGFSPMLPHPVGSTGDPTSDHPGRARTNPSLQSMTLSGIITFTVRWSIQWVARETVAHSAWSALTGVCAVHFCLGISNSIGRLYIRRLIMLARLDNS